MDFSVLSKWSSGAMAACAIRTSALTPLSNIAVDGRLTYLRPKKQRLCDQPTKRKVCICNKRVNL